MGYSTEIARVLRMLDDADSVLVGAGAGLSASAGFTYAGERFRHLFADFEQRYGFHDMYSGGFYPYETPEEYWAYWSRYIMCNRYESPVPAVYADLKKLIGDKDYFILTTNVDHWFQKGGFDKERLFYTQGDYGLFQCSGPCSPVTYDNEGVIRSMVVEQRDMRIPSSLVPVCPRCGALLTMNLRVDASFVEDEGWHRASDRYSAFLRRCGGGKMVLLELGVGSNTPGIIKYPFWHMAAFNADARYVSINLGEAQVPRELAARSCCIDADIADVLQVMTAG